MAGGAYDDRPVYGLETSGEDDYEKELKRYSDFLTKKTNLDNQYWANKNKGLKTYIDMQEKFWSNQDEEGQKRIELEEALAAAKKAAGEGVEGASEVVNQIESQIQDLPKYYALKNIYKFQMM